MGNTRRIVIINDRNTQKKDCIYVTGTDINYYDSTLASLPDLYTS